MTQGTDLQFDFLAQAKDLWQSVLSQWEKEWKDGRYPKQMLRLAASLPFTTQSLYTVVPANQLLDAVFVRCVTAEKNGADLTAAAIGEYGRYLLEHVCSSKPTEHKRHIALYQILAKLHRKQGMIHLAYHRLTVARQLTEDAAEKRRFNERHLALSVRRREVSKDAHDVFVVQLNRQLRDPAFAQLVREDFYRQMVAALEKPRG